MPGDVQITGTPTAMTTKPTDEGGTIHQDSVQPSDLDARTGAADDVSFFQEVTQFIAETAVAQSIPPMAAVVRVKQMLEAMERDRSV